MVVKSFGALIHNKELLIDFILASLDLPEGFVRRIGLLILAILFVTVGIDHFVHTEFYVSIMPPYIPAHLELVLISGVFEIIGGFSLLWGRVRRLSGLCLMALLIAVYPANIHMAMNPELFPAFNDKFLYVRLVLQFIFLYWVYEVTLREIILD
jgi:uncharacterized membrane protein